MMKLMEHSMKLTGRCGPPIQAMMHTTVHYSALLHQATTTTEAD
jgi:hypothetical protein